MKASQHRVTGLDLLKLLCDGDQSAENLGATLWPDKIGYGPARGGPGSCAVSASYLLGKLRKRQLVGQDFKRHRWYITDAGRKHLETQC